MKTTTTTLPRFGYAALAALATLALHPAAAQNNTVTRGVDVKGVDVRGADVTGSSVTGGSVIGGSVTGGSVTGSSVTGGSITAGSVTPGLVTAFANDREIRVRALGSVTVNTNGANAEVKIGKQTLLIEKAKLLLDSQPLADLPPDTKKVEIEVEEARLIVKADGKKVTTKALDHHNSALNDAGHHHPEPSPAQDTADRARRDADRARSEADRLRQEAERIREEADRLRHQADRLRNQ